MRTAVILCLTVASLALSGAPAAADAKGALTGRYQTERFDVRYRPGSRAGAAVERDAAMADRDFASICKELEFTPDGRFTIWLFDDVPELWLITGKKNVGGYSAGRESFLPQGRDQTRYHELAHLVTALLPKTGGEPRNMFFPDGLANSLLEYVDGVHVHAVTKFHRQRKELPRLGELVRGDFYAWQKAHPRIKGYDIGGSFFLFLANTYGIQNVKRYYGGTPAKEAFGVNEAKLETAWHKVLDGYELRREVETLLHQRAGEMARFTEFEADPDERIPADLLGKPRDWKSLVKEKLHPRDDTPWKRDGKEIVGTSEGNGWRVCELGTREYEDCVVRARIETENILGGVRLQLGDGCCAMLVGNGTFVWSNDRGVSSSPRRGVDPNGEVDLMMVRRGGSMQVWVDGFMLAEGAVDAAARPVGIGFHCAPGERGTARFSDVRVRVLK
jgi:hypothetical protein